LQATYAEASSKCEQMGLHLVVFECYSELLQLIENTKNLTGDSTYLFASHVSSFLCYILDRVNYSSYVAMKKKGLIYHNPDGNPSNKAAVASGINGIIGDCAVFKNGSLLSFVCDQPAFFICENKYLKMNYFKLCLTKIY